MNNYIQVHRYLQKFDIKPSVQRTAVMDYLMKNKTHPTIEEIYTSLSPMMPTLSKTTIYNTLNLFVQKGAVLQLALDEKNARYDADIRNHAHFKCNNCAKVYDFMDLSQSLYNKPEVQGFEIKTIEISYSGICPSCKGTN